MRRIFLQCLFLATSATAAEPTVEDRLRTLETQVQQLARENAELKKQLGYKDGAAPVLPQPAGKETKLSIGGFLQAQAEFGRAADARWSAVKDRFFFRRARIYMAGSFAEDFDFKVELDLQGNSLGAATGLRAQANEIFLNWHKYDYANLRFGQLKPAFGVENLTSDTKLPTIERSLASDRLTDPRQLAAGLSGVLLDKRVSYLVVVGNGSGANVSVNDNSKFQKSARVAFTVLNEKDNQLTLGVDGLWTTDAGVAKSGLGLTGNLFTGRRAQWGLDADWKAGGFELSGEWLQGAFRPANAVPAAEFDARGWQLTGAWFVVPHTLQAVVRRETFDPNTSLPGNTSDSWTLGFNYLIKGDDLKLQVEYLVGRVPGASDDGGRLLTRFQLIF